MLIEKSHDRYRNLRPLGSGGMGQVFEATDAKLHRTVALKFARPRANRRAAARQLAREAAVMALPQGSRTCSVYDLASCGGRTCLVMERLVGQTLEDRLAAGPLSTSELVDIAIQVAEALRAIHRVGLVHQDIKPANIFLTADGGVKVLDFGLTTVFGDRSGGCAFESARARRQVMGTPNYVAPERLLRCPADFRSDLFSLGVVIYEMATGWPPFAADTCSGVIVKLLEARPVGLRALNAARPVALERLVQTLLARHPADRCPSAVDLVRSLRRIRATTTASNRHHSRQITH